MVDISIPDEVVKKFASKTDLAGWYHNPYAGNHALHNGKADALATKIAEQYIDLFTAALRKRGLMPFCGVEINFDSHSINDHAPSVHSNAAGGFGGVIGVHTSETKIVYRLSQMGQWLLEQQARAYIGQSPHSEAFEHAEKVIESPEKYSDEEVEAQQYVYRSLLEDAQKQVHTAPFYNPMANGEGVYFDSQNVEVCTPPLSPTETTQLVNLYKRVFFEASDEFSRAFDAKDTSVADALRHPLANWLKNGTDPFNISYTLDGDHSGEHVSLSLQYDPEHEKNYKTALTTNKGQDFANDNLMGHGREWANLVLEIFKLRLGSDKILTIGLDDEFAPSVGSTLSRVNVETFADQFDESTNRVELRHFHHSGSNIALSMVGILANLYAVVLATEKVEKKLGLDFKANPEHMTSEIRGEIKRELAASKPKGDPDIYDYDGIERSFQKDGLTLDMMREVAQEAFAEEPDALRGALVDVKKFERAVCNRAKAIMKPSWIEADYGRA